MIFILYGPSGSGKTLAGEYLKTIGIEELVSHTTRRRRPGEVHGKSYYFVDHSEFEKLKKIEQSIYAGEFYGVSEEEVMLKYQGKPVFAVMDKNGVRAFCERFKEDIFIIEIKTSPRKMRDRMKKRGESEQIIRRRMKYYLEERKSKKHFHPDFSIDNNSTIRNLNKMLDITISKTKNRKK